MDRIGRDGTGDVEFEDMGIKGFTQLVKRRLAQMRIGAGAEFSGSRAWDRCRCSGRPDAMWATPIQEGYGANRSIAANPSLASVAA